MHTDFDNIESHLLYMTSKDSNIDIENILIEYMKYIDSLDMSNEKLEILAQDRKKANKKATSNYISYIPRTYYMKKVQIIDAIISSINDRKYKQYIPALYKFNYALSRILSPSDVIRKFDGTKIEVESGDKARELAWNNYCKHGNEIAEFLRSASVEDIDRKLTSLTPVNLTDKDANLQISNEILTGEMNQDDAASFCFLMGLLCNVACGYDTRPISNAKEYVYNAYATTYGSVRDLQKLYDELVAPRNQSKILTSPKSPTSEQE